MTTQFTPGPWVVPALVHDGMILNVEASPDRNAEFHICCVPAFTQSGPANARLIASAPALYEALKAMVAAFEDGEPLTVDATTYKTALAALSQAEGK